MFFLPSLKKSIILLILCCVGFAGFSVIGFFPSTQGFFYSFSLGILLFFSTLFLDYIISNIILRNDPIYVLRRSLALSLFCWSIWSGFLILGLLFGVQFGKILWLKIVFLSFAVVLTFRAVIFLSTSSVGIIQRILSSFIHPFLHFIILLFFWEIVFGFTSIPFFPYLSFSSLVGFLSAIFFLFILDQMGQKDYGVHAIPLFRAFMLNWVVGLNAPFEKFLEKLGKNELIEIMLLKFDALTSKAAIIVPFVHPGPFKNIGSSLLPSLMKKAYEKEFKCGACVPLGILGHELDLASEIQNKKIIKAVLENANFNTSPNNASPFVKVTENEATASCQIFGKVAFISFTLAPETTEDLPQELGTYVREEAKKLGIECSIVVNAHNSIKNILDFDLSLETLKKVALKSLKKALSLPHYPFEVGIKTVYPKEFTLKDGLGPGGITSLVVNVAEQKTAYVVIDGNNMVSGLREELLSSLKSSGFHEAEVFTTDTHAVSAVVLGTRGYHPIGEKMDKTILFNHILRVTEEAALNLESCRSGCVQILVPDIRVIGEERLHSLSTLVDSALQRAKKIVFPIFGIEGFLLIAFLSFFV
jgi:putative membrane protein